MGRPPPEHGAPIRLLNPGWYGVANVKWLERIEVIDTRFAGHFMARDYVTIREEQRDGQPVWVETLVGRALLKSAPARVTRKDGAYRIMGAAWGTPVASVEVQVDGGPWMPATIDEGLGSDFSWKFWSLSWPNAAPGEHAITSRATDTSGTVQPALTDPRSRTRRPTGRATARSRGASKSPDRGRISRPNRAGHTWASCRVGVSNEPRGCAPGLARRANSRARPASAASVTWYQTDGGDPGAGVSSRHAPERARGAACAA